MHELLQRDVDLIRLAREIAVDHYDIEAVLDRYQLSYDAWGTLLEFPRFRALLANEEEAWASAKNTKERVKLKAAALIEGYLEEVQKSLHDGKETLVAKTGLAKLVAGFAGLGTEEGRFAGGIGGGNGGFSITINLGEQSVNFGGRNSGFSAIPELEGGSEYENVYEINADLGATSENSLTSAG